MTCDEAREAFSDLYDGALSGAPLAALDRHLEGCPACREEWDLFLKTVVALDGLGGAEPSPGFAARVLERVQASPWWRRAAETLFVPVRVKVPMQALGLVLVAFTAVMIFQRSPDLRRQAEVRVAPEPAARQATPPPASPPTPAQPAPPAAGRSTPQQPVGRAEGPAPTAAPRTEDKGAGESLDAKGQADAFRYAGQERPNATPAAPMAPAARLEAEKDRAAGAAGRADMASPRPETPRAPSARREPSPAPQPPAGVPARDSVTARRAPSPAQEEAKELGKTAVPAEAGKLAEPLPKSRAKEPEPGVAGRRFRESAPGPAESRPMAPPAPAPPAAAAPPAPSPLKAETPAPAKEGQIASISAGSADELYSAGLTEFARQSYERSAEDFRAFIAKYPRDARVPDARFWLADSYFAQQRYAEAIPEYEALLRQFPDSRRVPAALLKQGQARLALGDQMGCQILRDMVDRYPRAREAAQAREALAARCP